MGGRGSYGITSRMPRYGHATIVGAKTRGCLPSPKNPGGKAAHFESLGYATRDAGRFENDLLKGLRGNRALAHTPNKRGDASIGVIMESGVTRKEGVVTARAIEAGSRNPRLVTAYPRKRKG